MSCDMISARSITWDRPLPSTRLVLGEVIFYHEFSDNCCLWFWSRCTKACPWFSVLSWVTGNFDKHQEHLTRLCYSGRALDAPPRPGEIPCSSQQFQLFSSEVLYSRTPVARNIAPLLRFGSTKVPPIISTCSFPSQALIHLEYHVS